MEDSPVTVRQSGRVRRKPAWMGENYQMLHSVPSVETPTIDLDNVENVNDNNVE